MGVHHFFTAPDQVRGDVAVLSGDEARHAARVLRVRPGERITISDDAGHVYDAVVRSVGDIVEADVDGVRDALPPRPKITVHQALMKGDRMDDMIERSVEVGVTRVAPFDAERSIVRWDHTRRKRAHERWVAVARSAAKQSRSPWLVRIDPVSDRTPEVAALVLHEEATTRLRDVLPAEVPEDLHLVIGPEGGLSAGEVERLVSSGATLVSLGERILRTETAAPVAATIIAFTYGSLG